MSTEKSKKKDLASFVIPVKDKKWLVYCLTNPEGEIEYAGSTSSFHPDFIEYLKGCMIEGFKGSSLVSFLCLNSLLIQF